MKTNNISKIVILLLLLLLFTSLNSTKSPNSVKVFQNKEITFPKSNADEIVIISPENKTYTNAMSGYYYATYGFENDIPGSYPEGFQIDEASNVDIEVVENVDGHYRVVEIDDRSSLGEYPGIRQYSYFPRSYGTIEFWLRVNSTTGLYYFSTRDTLTDEVVIQLRIESGKWTYRISGVSYDVPNVNNPKANTWHYVRIDFRCSGAPSYLGISEDRFIAIIDGISSGELQHAHSGKLDYSYFHVGTGPTEVIKGWVDAIGFNWDQNYNIGDNLNEGLLLSFDSAFTPDWLGYSLDGLPNKTILGNTSIQMPTDGPHNIQVFGNNTLGTMYASSIRYFTVDTIPPVISIISPTSGQNFNNPPSFILSITEANLVSSWYTLNGGSNIPFIGTSGTIDSTAWNSLADGPVTIRFYAEDGAGDINSTYVIVMKDTILPYITINNPIADTSFGTQAPDFSISIIEVNLVTSRWYTIEGSTTEYHFTGTSGTIDQTAWDSAAYGDVTITFYAEDEAGNIGMKNVIVTKSSPVVPPEIPGYNILLMVCISIGIIGVIAKRRRTS